jgi:hypothetical protein
LSWFHDLILMRIADGSRQCARDDNSVKVELALEQRIPAD